MQLWWLKLLGVGLNVRGMLPSVCVSGSGVGSKLCCEDGMLDTLWQEFSFGFDFVVTMPLSM